MTANFPIYLLVMAGVTYLIRMLPLTIFRKEIKSTFIKSFLHYVPFAVLGAMTIPDVLYSTGDMRTAAVGLVVAVFLAWKPANKKSSPKWDLLQGNLAEGGEKEVQHK